MKFKALSQLQAKNLPPGKHCDGQGLWLVKRTQQFGNWILRLTVNGKRREMGLGPWPEVSIKEARQRAAAARYQVRDNVDPIAARAKARSRTHSLTFTEALNRCFEARKAELKGDGVPGQWLSPPTVHVVPKIGTLPVIEIDQHVLKSVFDPIWHEKPEAALKALNRVGLTLKHAAALGLDVDLQAVAKTKALLGKQRRTVRHIPSMPYQEVPAFYAWLSTQETIAALALRLLILTVARTSEVRLATEAEIEDSVWVLPPERTKTGTEHRIPLTSEAMVVIEIAKERSDTAYLFTSLRGKPLSDMAMSKLMRDHGYTARPHGFRASFRTWCEEQTNAPFEVKEACLGHAVDTGTVGAYQRSDRMIARMQLISAWNDFLLV